MTADLEDLRTHRDAWRNALMNCAALAGEQGDDADSSYWQHEIKVFDRTFDALATARNAVIEECAALAENYYYWQGSSNLADSHTKEWIAAAIRNLKGSGHDPATNHHDA